MTPIPSPGCTQYPGLVDSQCLSLKLSYVFQQQLRQHPGMGWRKMLLKYKTTSALTLRFMPMESGRYKHAQRCEITKINGGALTIPHRKVRAGEGTTESWLSFPVCAGHFLPLIPGLLTYKMEACRSPMSESMWHVVREIISNLQFGKLQSSTQWGCAIPLYGERWWTQAHSLVGHKRHHLGHVRGKTMSLRNNATPCLPVATWPYGAGGADRAALLYPGFSVFSWYTWNCLVKGFTLF